MSKRFYIALVLVVLMTFSLTGCPRVPGQPNGNQTEPQTPAQISPLEYFPLPMGGAWVYAGEGNEYAAFSRQVIAVEDNLAQVQEDTGGTIGTAIFLSSEDEIVRIFWEGEQSESEILLNAQPNDSTIIIKAPIQLGHKWENQSHSREIVGIDEVVETPAGSFQQCLKLEVSFPQSKIFEYYHPGVGLVMRQFISEGYTVTSTLAEYSLE